MGGAPFASFNAPIDRSHRAESGGMSSTTRDAKDQPLEDENRPGRPAGPSRHWQTSADALYAMAREVLRLKGAVVTERHWCAEYVRGRAFLK